MEEKETIQNLDVARVIGSSEWCTLEKFTANIEVSRIPRWVEKQNASLLRLVLLLQHGVHNGISTTSAGYGYSHLEELHANSLFDQWTCRRLYVEKKDLLEQQLHRIGVAYGFWRRHAAFLTWAMKISHAPAGKPKFLPDIEAVVSSRLKKLLRQIVHEWHLYAQRQRDQYRNRCGRALMVRAAKKAEAWLLLAFHHWRIVLREHMFWKKRCFDHWELFVMNARYRRFLDEFRIGDAHYHTGLKKRVFRAWGDIAKLLRRVRIFLWRLKNGLLGIAWSCWLQVIKWEKTCERRRKRKTLHCWHWFIVRRKMIVKDFYLLLLLNRILRSWRAFASDRIVMLKIFHAWRGQAVAALHHGLLVRLWQLFELHWTYVEGQTFQILKQLPPKPEPESEPEPEPKPEPEPDPEPETDPDSDPQPEPEPEPEPEVVEVPPPSPPLPPKHKLKCRCVICLRKYGKVGAQPAKFRGDVACSQSHCHKDEHLERRLSIAREMMDRALSSSAGEETRGTRHNRSIDRKYQFGPNKSLRNKRRRSKQT